MITEIQETYEEISARKRAELQAAIERGEVGGPFALVPFFISLGVSVALSGVSMLVSRALNKPPRLQQGKLSGAVQLQNSEQGIFIPEIYGASPTISLTAGSNPTYINQANVTTGAGGSITKNAGGALWNAGASHDTAIASGDAFFEFTVGTGYAGAGFTNTASPTNANTDLYFGIQWNPDGSVTLRYSGSQSVPNATHWVVGDRFRVEIREGRYRLYKGSAEIRPANFVSPTPTYPTYAGIAIQFVGAGVSESKVKIGSIGLTPNAGRGGIKVPAIIVYSSKIRKNVSTTQQPTGGGKGSGGRTQTVENTTYDIDLGMEFGRGTNNLLRLYANADVLIDQVQTSLIPTGVHDPDVDPDDDYDPTIPPDPNDVYIRPILRESAAIDFDIDNVGSGTIQGGGSLFTIYEGNETQDPDPTIEADIDAQFGAGSTPAYRGHTLVVLKQLLLTRWGGIVPNFTAVWEHSTLKTFGPIFASFCERVGVLAANSDYDFDDLTGLCRGLLIAGRTFRPSEIIGSPEIQLAGNFFVTEVEGQIVGYAEGAEPSVTIPDTKVGWLDNESDLPDVIPEIDTILASEIALNRQVDVKFIDPDKEWDPNTQSAKRQITEGVGVELVEVQLCLLADEARAMAQRKLYRDYVAGSAHRFTLSWEYLYLHPGYRVTITRAEGFSHVLRLTSISGGLGVLECEGFALEPSVFTQPAPSTIPGNDPNKPVPAMTILMLLDIPIFNEGHASFNDGIFQYAVGTPRTGFNQSWRGHADWISRNNEWKFLGQSEVPGVIGTVVSAVALSTDTETTDNVGMITVDLYGTTATLTSVTEAEMLAGENPALAGDMIFYFADATQLAGFSNRWELSTLLNGQKGTGQRISEVVAGMRFVLLNQAVFPIPMQLSDLNSLKSYKAVTSGQSLDDAATVTHVWSGKSLVVDRPTEVQVFRDTKSGGGGKANQIQLLIPPREHEIGETVKYWADVFSATAGPAFTVDAATNVFTSAAHGLVAGDYIALSTTGTLPVPLAARRHYFLRDITTNTFKLAASEGGDAIDLLDTGSGTHKFTRRVRHMPVANIGAFNPALLVVHTPNDTPPPDGEWQFTTTAGSGGWDSTITSEWTERNDVVGNGPGSAGGGITAVPLALFTESGAEIEFTLGTVDYEPGIETDAELVADGFSLGASETVYRRMRFTVKTDADLPTSKAGSRRWKLTIYERIGGTLTLVYTDPDFELPGMRYRMQISGSELRYYRDYGGPNSKLLYRSTELLPLPLRPRFAVATEHIIEDIKIGGLPDCITTYPDTDMVSDFVTQPATVRFRVYEERIVAGVSFFGPATDFIT